MLTIRKEFGEFDSPVDVVQHDATSMVATMYKQLDTVAERDRIPNWQAMRVSKGCPEAHLELDDASGPVSSVVASLTIVANSSRPFIISIEVDH